MQFIKSGIALVLDMISRVALGRGFLDLVLKTMIERSHVVFYHGLRLDFAVPNTINFFRIATFSTKEPETLDWIESIPSGSVLWDVGANVGLYSCYAAKARDCLVFAFEPSVFNLELLARNIHLNGVVDRITIIPLPLSDVLATSTLNMTTTDWGGALSSFGQSYGHDGRPLHKQFEFRTLGISMVDAIERLNISQPDYIKMDVDGIEHLILQGGQEVLRNIQGILIEVNEEFEQQSVDVARYLTTAGLVMKDKRHATMFEDTEFKHSYNQIWYRLPM